MVGDFNKADCNRFQSCTGFDASVDGALGRKMVGRFAKLQTNFSRNARDGKSCEIRVRINPGADRRAAKSQSRKVIFKLAESVDSIFHLCGITTEFLAQPDGCGVLQVSPSNLEDTIELLRFIEQR